MMSTRNRKIYFLSIRAFAENLPNYSRDPEIGPPMGLTESGPILESVRFVEPVNIERRDTSQSVYRYALLRIDIKVDYYTMY